ncbi:2,3-bisphosphoglycerate-independent phosphoglycerate mutase [Bacilli bacterium PM5-9]|nr:2,3-bisphosphoglycerate-independent phosphoglycerate mutase [Bacilli bacterium PM5-9]
MKKPIVLCILDGIGNGIESDNNACFVAKTPTLDYLKATYPHSELKTGGMAVGLPDGQMGNSEVGHLNMGAGRVVYQSLTLINKAIEDKSFYQNKAFLKAINNAKENNKSLHLMGLLSDGGVHSHIDHLKALLSLAKENNLTNVYVHAFLDGRDTLRDTGKLFVKEILDYMSEINCGKLASISGRYYAMDRDCRFERNYKTYQSLVLNEGLSFDNALDYIQKSYDDDVYDEFILPAYNSEVNASIKNEDSVIFFNFRPDRAIQLASILTNPNYQKVFEKQPKDLCFVSMMKYDKSVLGLIAFEHPELKNVLGVYLADNDFKQLRIAETEKYAHVTFFFDGQVKYDGINNPELKGCKRILIDSPKVATYDLKPEMSAYEINKALLEELDKNYLDVVVLNFANGDMVGHTGNIAAAIKAVETVDSCLSEIYQKVSDLGGVLLITADHGNCEEMLDEDNNILTAHSLNDVSFIMTKNNVELNDGKLCDIAPTILDLLEIKKPVEMTGKSLIK